MPPFHPFPRKVVLNSWLYGASGRKFYKLARLAQIQLELSSQALSLVDSRLNFQKRQLSHQRAFSFQDRTWPFAPGAVIPADSDSPTPTDAASPPRSPHGWTTCSELRGSSARVHIHPPSCQPQTVVHQPVVDSLA